MRPPIVAAITAILSCLPYAVAVHAGEIAVTRVSVTPGTKTTAEIEINAALVMRGVVVTRSGGETVLEFPRHVTKTGRVYPLVRVLTRQADDAVRRAVETGAVAAGPFPALTYRIGHISLTKKSSLRAFVRVVFNDVVEVECSVFDGANGAWVSWPSRNKGRQRVKLAVVTDKRLREAIEQEILDTFATSVTEGMMP